MTGAFAPPVLRTRTGIRLLSAVRCGSGLLCLVAPRQVAAAVGGSQDRATHVFIRILGGRELAQGAVALAAPTRPVLLTGAVVDGIHVTTMIGLAAVDPRRRGPALVNAVTATGWALSGWYRARRPA